MSNIQIYKRNFEQHKNKIQALSNNVPRPEQLPTLETEGGLFNWFDKKVTGAEMNHITGLINSGFIKSNKEIIKLYNQFKEVYNTFDTLDREYIQGIVTAVEAAEVASQQALEASKEALSAQKDIKRVVDALKISVSELKKTKDELSVLKNHFEKIERYFDTSSNEIAEIGNVEELEKKLNKHEEYIFLLSDKIVDIGRKKQDTIYWVAGGALFLALLQFVLLMFKVL